MAKLKIKESDLAQQVEELLNLYGWCWCHFRPAIERSGKWLTALSGQSGFPDYIAARGHRLLIFELKSEKGKLSEVQEMWLHVLDQCPIEVHTWRPSDWEEIVGTLRR